MRTNPGSGSAAARNPAGFLASTWKTGRREKQLLDSTALATPLSACSKCRPAEYYVQSSLFRKYETFNRSDGHTVKLPMDRGEGQHWNRAPATSTAARKGGG